MPIEFGENPDTITVHLTRGTSFEQTVEASDKNGTPVTFADGTSIELRFDDTVWPAQINGNVVSWERSAADVAAVFDAREANVWIVLGDRKKAWFLGTVARHG